MIAIVDYDAGNIMSVQKACAYLGRDYVLTRKPEEILRADHVILPGVGAFGDAMEKLHKYALPEVLKEVRDKGTPFLGICLGLQLLFEESEESPGVKGLGLLPGKIIRIPDGDKRLKIPHMGWNSLHFPKAGRLFEGLPEGADVYFVHSYYLPAGEGSGHEDIITAQTEYGVQIGASVEKGNLFACQFHPEKSSHMGLRILVNFLRI